jgi:plastocyanin
MESSMFSGGSLVAAFVAGGIALFAPYCISVMLPAYFAGSFQNRQVLVAMTLLFAAGIATVILPLAMGASVLRVLLVAEHTPVFVIGGLTMLVLASPRLHHFSQKLLMWRCVRLTAIVPLGCLFVLAEPAGVAVAGDWSHAETIRVKMLDYSFEPSRLDLRRGVPYRLSFVNNGKELHELTAPEFLKTVKLGNAKALSAANAELEVPPAAEKDLYLIPRLAGRYRFFCADHDWAGMVGEIAVR